MEVYQMQYEVWNRVFQSQNFLAFATEKFLTDVYGLREIHDQAHEKYTFSYAVENQAGFVMFLLQWTCGSK